EIGNDKKKDRAAYERIAARFREAPASPEGRMELASALGWIERSKSWGASPATPIAASPDGQHAVISLFDQPVLLVNTTTLATRKLMEETSERRHTPDAWSLDSRIV